MHGRPLRVEGRVLVPLHHPAAALRVPALRDTLRADARRVRAVLDGVESPREPDEPG